MKINRQNDGNAMIGKMLMFIVAPFLTFLYSLRDIGTRSSFWVLILFNLYFGFNFTVTNDRSAEKNLDGSLYREYFERYCSGIYNGLDERIDVYLGFDDEASKDVYIDVISFLVSQITSNYHILFLVYALIFTFFMGKSLMYLLQSNSFRNGSFVCFILFSLFVFNDIFNINGVRFWTAAWVAVYSIFKVFVDNNKNYIALCCLTPLIHASYILFGLIFLLALIFNKYAIRLRKILLFSIFLSPLMVIFLQSVDISSMPSFFGRYMELYASDEALSAFSEKHSSTLYYIITNMFNVASLFYINILILKIAKVTWENNLKSPLTNFLVMFSLFCNLTMIIPSLGGRYLILCYPLIAYLWLNVIGIYKMSNWIKVLPLFFILSIRSKLLLYTHVLDSDFFYMNLFSMIIKNL